MSRIHDYIRRVMEIAGLPVDHQQGEEMTGHILDLAAQFEQEGDCPDHALDKAIEAFGAPEQVGRRLREVTPLRLEPRDCYIAAVAVAAAAVGEVLWPGPAIVVAVLILSSAAALLSKRPVAVAASTLFGIALGGFISSLIYWLRYNELTGHIMHYPNYTRLGGIQVSSAAAAAVIGVLAAISRREGLRVTFFNRGLLARLAIYFAVAQAEFVFKEMHHYIMACVAALLIQGVIIARRWPDEKSSRQRLLLLLANLAPLLVVLDNLFSDMWEIVVFGLTIILSYVEQERPEFAGFTWQQVLAGIAQLAPFCVLFGLTRGTAATLLALAIWYWQHGRSAFVARHALQGGAVGAAALLSQVLVYQLVSVNAAIPWLAVMGALLSVLRLAFGVLAGWAAISAFAGHDFRYPFAGALFGGGNWRRIRHI